MKTCFKWRSIKELSADLYSKIKKGKFAQLPSIVKAHMELCSLRDSEIIDLIYELEESDKQAIEDLLESEFDFDVEDSSGMTAVMRAVMIGNYEHAKILHLAHVFLLLNSQTERKREPWDCYELSTDFLEWKKLEIPVVYKLIAKMREERSSSHQIGKVLAKVTEFRICDVVVFDDLAMTKSFLQSLPDHKNLFGTRRAFEIITPTLNLNHVKVILRTNERNKVPLSIFCRHIMKNITSYHRTQAGQNFLENVFSCDIFNENNLQCLEEVLKETKKKNLKIFLKYIFHVDAKAEYGRDVLACLFNNRVDTTIVSLLKDKHLIDVDGCGYDGNTPLHFAAYANIPENVQMLLDIGANPNRMNLLRETPLLIIMRNFNDYQETYECARMLLLSGINRCFVNDVFQDCCWRNENWSSSLYVKLVKLFLAQAVLNDPTSQSIRTYVNMRKTELAVYYHQCIARLNDLKACKIRDIPDVRVTNHRSKLTIHDILIEDPKKSARNLQEQDLQAIIAFVKINKSAFNLYYLDLLKKQLRELSRIDRHRIRALRVLCEMTSTNDPRHLVNETILSYLTCDDLINLSLAPTVV